MPIKYEVNIRNSGPRDVFLKTPNDTRGWREERSIERFFFSFLFFFQVILLHDVPMPFIKLTSLALGLMIIYMVSGTRDKLPPKKTLASVYMIRKWSY